MRGTRDTGLVTVESLFENPARYYAGKSKLDGTKHFDGLWQSLESKRDRKRTNLFKISVSLPPISTLEYENWTAQSILTDFGNR